MVHLIDMTALLNKGLGDYLRCYWGENGHIKKLVSIKMRFKPPNFSTLPEQLVICDKLSAPIPQLSHHLLLSPNIHALPEGCCTLCSEMLFFWRLVEILSTLPKPHKSSEHTGLFRLFQDTYIFLRFSALGGMPRRTS